ncbi:MAG: glutamate synthase subunit beta [Puniceicoccales bacterium]|nr:glutamate synthase subunit beta [Puniceicoccales bacterium]
MGKPTGFLEHNREIASDRPPSERLGDWKDFHTHLPDSKLGLQTARCMDCGVPYCQGGISFDRTPKAGCTLHNNIPEFNHLVWLAEQADGESAQNALWFQAYQRLAHTSNFPEFTSRVCPALCEVGCVAGGHGFGAVTIKSAEYAIIEKAFANAWVKPCPPASRTGKKVAVVGSGASGLAAAAQLNAAGHTVDVYERADRAGGLLMYGIPNMKLEKNVVERRVALMRSEGINFILDTPVGGSAPGAVSAQELLGRYDVVALCVGSTTPRNLAAEGRQLDGVHFAVPYLTAATKALLAGDPAKTEISAKGKHVIVIGGGDTGNDCVGTALRQGAASVTQLEIMAEPPERRDTAPSANPWPQWPNSKKTDYGQEEAAFRQGADPRRYLTTVKKLNGDANGKLVSAEIVKVKWGRNDKGAPVPEPQRDTEETLPAGLVLIAMGFIGPEQTLLKEFGLDADPRGNIAAKFDDSGNDHIFDHTAFQTSNPKVFAAGDGRSGQSLIVSSIREGRQLALAANEYLAK